MNSPDLSIQNICTCKLFYLHKIPTFSLTCNSSSSNIGVGEGNSVVSLIRE